MYARLDDELLDHRKIFHAGELLGRNGPAIALGMYAVGLMYANRHLTDGVIPLSVLRTFRHVSRPLRVAKALVSSGLWEKNGTGYRIHDFGDCNPSALEVKAKRKRDRLRKKRERAV